MVNVPRAMDWLYRPFVAIGRDVGEWWTQVCSRSALRAGLFTYHVHPPGGTRRIHLRIGDDGGGMLMVDATDVVHLNRSATAIVKLALDGRPREQVLAALSGRFDGVRRDDARRHIDEIYDVVHHLTTTADRCTTCGLDVERRPLFSTPISAPYKADLALTYGCNNACGHCYNRAGSPAEARPVKKSPLRAPAGTMRNMAGWSGAGQRDGMSLRQWKKALRKLAGIGVPHVVFTGGEPTLFPGLSELVGAAERLGLITGLNTNGRLLADPEMVDALARAGLSHVQITLESRRADVHNTMTSADSFHQTCRGISNAIVAGLHVTTNTTLTRKNVAHALETVDFLHRLGVETFAMNGMIFAGRGRSCGDAVAVEELGGVLAAVRDRAKTLGMRFLWYTPTEYCRLSPLELELGARRCNAGEYSMCIEPNGDVLPCQSYYEVAGNILRDPWPSIWESDLFRGFRDRVCQPHKCGLPQRCWRCADLAVCGGGCRLERMRNE